MTNLPSFTRTVYAGLTVLAGIACGQDPAAPGSPPGVPTAPMQTAPTAEPAALVRAAISSVSAQTTIAAKLGLRTDLFGRSLSGSGMYWEQRAGDERRLRMEVSMVVPDTASSLSIVCDDKYRWQYFQMGREVTFTRVELAQVREALARAPEAAALRVACWTEMGGLPRMLASLNQAFVWQSAQAGRLANWPVWKLDGVWNPAYLELLAPEQKAAIAAGRFDLSRLPPQVPDRVVVFLGQEDLFPYRFEYHRDHPPRKAKYDDLTKGPTALLAIQLSEVSLNGAIDPSVFTYNPSNQKPTDDTANFLARLGLR